MFSDENRKQSLFIMKNRCLPYFQNTKALVLPRKNAIAINMNPSASFPTIAVQQADGAVTLHISGHWTVAYISKARQVQKSPPSSLPITMDGSGIEELDISGGWLLMELLWDAAAKGASVQWQGFSEPHFKIIQLVSRIEPIAEPAHRAGYITRLFTLFGKTTIHATREAGALISFFGRLCATFSMTVMQPKRLRVKSVFYHMNDIGIRATPIVLLMAFLMSMVLGYQGATQLSKFGATIFTINLVAISILREMGVLITAIMVAGRSSSAFAAQIGVMQMNDEVAALRTMGLDPFELLILPRMIAIVLMLPVLTFLADLAGLAGTFLMGRTLLDMSVLQCAERLRATINAQTFFIGLVKAPVFAILIGMVGCLQGLQVRNSATELGARTTQAVVQSIFLVLLADALFSILFTMAGI
jgi:phospholipid/cholesterol/gamma-HCH transport system permease protein